MKTNTPFRTTLGVVACCLTVTAMKVCADTKTEQIDSSKVPGKPSVDKAPSQTNPNSKSDSKKSSSTVTDPSVEGDRYLSRGEILARTALSYRGLPYRFGGQSSRSGFDCSGLVQTVCAKWGIYLPRAANAQFSKGKRVLPQDLQPGDLVFFSDTYKHGLSHVGIYIGDGKFLHAATREKGVIVSDLSEAYHRKHYCGAIRLDLSKLPAAPDEDKTPLRIILNDPDADTGTSPASETNAPATPH